MKKIEIIRKIQRHKTGLLTTEDLKKLLNIEKENTLYKTTERLLKDGILSHLVKGKYQYEGVSPSSFQIANFIHSPSYISLESALNFYGVLIQSPYQITSVTPLRNKTIRLEDFEYTYSHISPHLYFGYRKEGSFLIATPEKALVDELYMVAKGLRTIDLDELKLDIINKKVFFSIADRIPNKLLKKEIKEAFK